MFYNKMLDKHGKFKSGKTDSFHPFLAKVFFFVFAAPVERPVPDRSSSPRSPPATPPTSSSKLLLGS